MDVEEANQKKPTSYDYPNQGAFLTPSADPYGRVRLASADDVLPCKRIADADRAIFGFLTRALFADAAAHSRLFVVEMGSTGVTGFLRFNHRRRGDETALYDIGVDAAARRQGLGRALIEALKDDCRRLGRRTIVLRCPEGAESNDFYARLGFWRVAVEPGRKRPLVVWQLPIHPLQCSS